MPLAETPISRYLRPEQPAAICCSPGQKPFPDFMDFKKFLPHLYAVLILLGVAAFFFAPNVFGGKALPQPDNDKARAIQTEIQDYIKKEGKAPLWTNSLFGGMPSFQIYTTPQGNLTKPITKALFLWSDSSDVWVSVFVAMLCMYILLIVLKSDWRVAVFGALAFGITSYNVDILEAGHSTKMAALALAPGMFAGAILLFNGRFLVGTGLLALFTSMEISVNHAQITYYTLLLLGIFGLVRLVDAIKTKSLATWGKAAALSAAALVIGIACNLSKVWPTYEYGQETIRGGSELKAKAQKGDGLDKDYLFGWSSGICESLTLLVPHASGGGAGESYANTGMYKMVAKNMPDNLTPQQLERQIGGVMYTGEQPFVGTAIYYGVIAVFLFFMGAFLVQGGVKWWLLFGGIFMVMLAWGKHFFLNDILYDYLPMFNKFRAVTMAFGLGQLCVAALAALGLQRLVDADLSVAAKKRGLFFSAGLTAVLCVLTLVCFTNEGPNDAALGNNATLLKAIQEDRSSMLYGDLYRSLGLLAAAFGLIWFYLRGTLKANLTVLIIAALALGDHWMVCRRTLNDTKYENKKEATALPKENGIDKKIKEDPSLYYRVMDFQGGGIATNYRPSFFHKNIGGYHAAKLQRFQEVVDTFLSTTEMAKNLHVLGMMNVKYAITQTGPNINPEACGNAWFVHHFDIVSDGDAEFNALHTLHPKDSAVFQEKYASQLKNFKVQPDSTATIKLKAYHPERLTYEYSAKTDQLAVFSEIYYPPSKGWKCYLNGQPAPDFMKADYLLRAMVLPAGQNQVLEMRFEPQSYILGEKVSFVASLLTLLLCFAGLYFWYKNGAAMSSVEHLSDVESAKESAKPTVAAAAKKKK